MRQKKFALKQNLQQVGNFNPAWLKNKKDLAEVKNLERELKQEAKELEAIEGQIKTLNSGNIHRAKRMGDLFLKIKEKLYGHFNDWLLSGRIKVSTATAYNYMKIAEDDFWKEVIEPRLPEITYREAIALSVKDPRKKDGKKEQRDQAEKLFRWLIFDFYTETFSEEQRSWLKKVSDVPLMLKQEAYRKIILENGILALQTQMDDDIAKERK